MSQPLSLESFEETLAETSQLSGDYNQGYEDGLAAGTAAAEAAATNLNEAFVQTVSDINFTYAEARGQIMQSLGPLFATLMARLLPHCVETGFAGQLADVLCNAANTDTVGALTLHVSPDSYDGVSAALADVEGQIHIKVDAALSPHAAWIRQDGTETFLDADSLLAEITAALETIQNEQIRTEAHG